MTRRDLLLGGGAVALLLLSMLLAVALGGVEIAPGRALDVLLGGEAGWERVVLFDLRLPRVVLAAVIGAGLSVAGAVMQGLFRNPMAEPGVLGVSGGAALGAVVVLYLLPPALSIVGVPLAAFAGGLACAFLVYGLATARGRTPISTLLLAGIAVGGIATALTSAVLSLALADWEVGREMLAWLMGDLEGRSWRHVALAAPLVAGGSIWLALHARELNVLLTGEESALSVGIDVARVKRRLIVLASLVTAATVAVSGVIGFVGLVVPHIVRLSLGPDHRRLLPFSFLLGAIALVWADVLCRAMPSGDLRLGVVTALAGGPFFLALLVRHRASLGAA